MLKCSAYINAFRQAVKPKANLPFTSWSVGTSKAVYLCAFTKKNPNKHPTSKTTPRHFTSIYLRVRLVAVSVALTLPIPEGKSYPRSSLPEPVTSSQLHVDQEHLKCSYQVVNSLLTSSPLYPIQPKASFNNSWCTGNTANTYIISHLLHFPSSTLLQQVLVFPR